MAKVKWFHISNDTELRVSYSILKKIEKDRPDMARSIKEAIRDYLKRQGLLDGMGRIVKDHGIDGYIALQELPETVQSVDEANDYFEENVKISYCDRGFDCTGQLFTNWYKVVKRHGRFYAYHSVGCDV